MKPIKALGLQLLAGLLFFMCSANVQAQDVKFECASVLIDEIQYTYEDKCTPVDLSSDTAGIQELTTLAASVFDFIDNYQSNPNSNCYMNTDYTIGCNLGDKQTPLSFNCTPGYKVDPISGASISTNDCNFNNADPTLAPVLTMNCSKTYDANENVIGNCIFSLNKAPIIDKMVATGRYGTLTSNQNAINSAFWTCLNRVNNTPEIQTQCDRILMKLANEPDTAKQLINLFQAVTPNNTDLSLDISAANIHNSINNIRTRLTQLRSGYATNSVNIQYFDGQQWLDANTLLAQNNVSMTDASPEKPARNMSEYGRLGVFLNGSAIDARQTGNIIEDSSDANTQIATLGMDYRLTDQWIAGLAVNISQSTAEYGRNTGQLDTDNLAMIAYGSYYLDNWYFDASINYGQDSYEQKRNIDCSTCPTAFVQSYTVDFDGSQSVISLGAGYQWQQNAMGITPFLQINSANIKTDAYDETPSSWGAGSNYALSISEQERDTSSVKVGTNFQYTFSTSQGVIIPLVGIQAIRELENNANTVTGHFWGNVATDASFNLATNDIDKSYFLVVGGLSFQLKNGNAGFIHIQSTEGYENLEQVQYTAGWRWEL